MRFQLFQHPFGTLRRALFCLACAGCTLVHPAFAQEADDVVALVDGIAITRGEVIGFISDLSPELRQRPAEEIWGPVVDRLINLLLMNRAAYELELNRTEEFALRMRRFELTLLENLYLQVRLGERLTEEAIVAAYDAFIAQGKADGFGLEIWARHILVETEEEAHAIVERLDAGEDFRDLAQELSIGPSGSIGGDLGWFGRGTMVPAFEDAAFDLLPGQTSQPVQTQFGWHIIKLQEIRAAAPPSLQELAPQLREQLTRIIVEETIAELREGAEIEILIPSPNQ